MPTAFPGRRERATSMRQAWRYNTNWGSVKWTNEGHEPNRRQFVGQRPAVRANGLLLRVQTGRSKEHILSRVGRPVWDPGRLQWNRQVLWGASYRQAWVWRYLANNPRLQRLRHLSQFNGDGSNAEQARHARARM